jgi:peptidoglycan/LPS O-acetylase OafA/YrhL
MKQWLKRIRGAVLMGLTWAAVWAPVAVVIGTTIVDPDDSMDEMWLMVGALPGFLGGIVFAAVLGIVARRRRFDDLSIPRFARWGAGAGLLVGVLPFLLGDQGPNVERAWLLPTVVITSITFLSSASAAGSLWLARRAEKRGPPDAIDGVDEVGSAGREAQGLIAPRVYESPAMEHIVRPGAGVRSGDA